MRDRYGLWDGIAETLQEIGDKLGITRERVRQIEGKALKQLRTSLPVHISEFLLNRFEPDCLYSGDITVRVIAEDELGKVFSDPGPENESALALKFIDDVFCEGRGTLREILHEVEQGVYAIDKRNARLHLELVRLIRESVSTKQRATLTREIWQSQDIATRFSLSDVERATRISPAFIALRNGSVALSSWPQFRQRTKPFLCMAALQQLGRPGHYTEVARTIEVIDPEIGTVNPRTVHNILTSHPDKFVWTKNGTYGLVEWGIKRPPYLKDRLIELLKKSAYPLPYWYLEEQALAVCACKPTSVRMTLDLNPSIFTKFRDDQYGLKA